MKNYYLLFFFLTIAYNNEQERHIFWRLSLAYCQSMLQTAEPKDNVMELWVYNVFLQNVHSITEP